MTSRRDVYRWHCTWPPACIQLFYSLNLRMWCVTSLEPTPLRYPHVISQLFDRLYNMSFSHDWINNIQMQTKIDIYNGDERVYLPLCKVADTPFHIQERGIQPIVMVIFLPPIHKYTLIFLHKTLDNDAQPTLSQHQVHADVKCLNLCLGHFRRKLWRKN